VLDLTTEEVRRIALAIAPELEQYAAHYNESKYPPQELARLRAVFAKPECVQEADVVAALVWKYGHTGKARFPAHQRDLANRIFCFWPANAAIPGESAQAQFNRWQKLLGRTSFITICFLLHLAHPRELPILDQHNYRAVNWHLATVHPGWPVKRKPSRFSDLLLVRNFTVALLAGWEPQVGSKAPAADVFDRYLMMYGKALSRSSRA
jgi:hypothetical protein